MQPLPLPRVRRLSAQGAGHRPLGVVKDGRPARLLGREPLLYTLAVGRPSGGGDMGGNAASPLAQCPHPPAFALARPGAPRVALRAPGLADRRRHGRQWLRERGARVAQAVAQAHPRASRPPALDGAVEALGAEAPDPSGWLLRERHLWARRIGRRHSSRPGVLRVAPRPEHATPDHGRQVHGVCPTAAMRRSSQASDGPGQPTPGAPGHPPLVAERPAETRARQGGERPDARAAVPTAPPRRASHA
jgi:hypothetical protein